MISWSNSQWRKNVQKNKDTLLEKLHEFLFSNGGEQLPVFDRDEQEIVLRYRASFVKWLSEPGLRDADMVGYLQSDGDGEFDVALRSALVRGHGATAWAGAGIVARSQPRAEYTETELKLRTVLGPLLW